MEPKDQGAWQELTNNIPMLHRPVNSSILSALLKSFLLLFGTRGKVLCVAAALIFILAGFKGAWGAEVCHHDLKVEVQPEAHRLIVQDDIRVAEWKGGEISFLLSDKANIKSVLVNGKPSEYSFSSGRLTLSGVSAAKGAFRGFDFI